MKTKLKALQMTVAKSAGRTGLKLKAASPEILMVVGVAGLIGSTVLACKATLKAGEVLEATNADLAQIKLAKETVALEQYSEGDYKKDLAITYTKTAVEFVKLYGPAVLLGSLSIMCLVSSNRILQRRNIALMAAYQAIEGSFKRYRGRVVEEFGAKVDHDFKNNIYQVNDVIPAYTDEEGKKHKAEIVKRDVIRTNGFESEYAKAFDGNNKHFEPNWEFNKMFLTASQNFANDKLRTRGHLFLNEVYEMLGYMHTPAGAVVGWVMGHGDDFVDFGALDVVDFEQADKTYTKGIILDFNVDGVIYDLI